MSAGGRSELPKQLSLLTLREENDDLKATTISQQSTIRLLERRVAMLELELRQCKQRSGEMASDDGTRHVMSDEVQRVEAMIEENSATRKFFEEQGIDTAPIEAELARLRSRLLAIGGGIPTVRPLHRTTSVKMSELLEISRATASKALAAADGNVNMAIGNLLTSVLDPETPPLLALVASATAGPIAGLSHDDARQLINSADGDYDEAAARLASSIADAAQQSPASDPLGDTGAALTRALSAPLVRPSRQFECKICLEDFEPVASSTCQLRSCGHCWCTNCLRLHVTAAIDDGATSVSCPAMSCDGDITQRELRALIGTERFSRLDRRCVPPVNSRLQAVPQLFRFVRSGLEMTCATDPTLHLCQTPDCTFITYWASQEDDGDPKLNCPLCKIERCLVCGASPYHTGLPCPQPASAEAHNRNDEEAATAAYMATNSIKPCPRCKIPLVKSFGCDKMKCRCGYRFCFACLSENAQCGCTPAEHGFIDNLTGRGDFSNLRDKTSPT